MNTMELFLALLSAGLNKTEYNIDELLTVEEWNTLYKYSMQQNVLPIIYEQLMFSGVFELAEKVIAGKNERLQEEAFAAIRYCDMFRDKTFQFTADQVKRTQWFYEYYEQILRLGIRLIVVKGIICRNTYPNPDLRPSGDEDLYIELKDYPILKEFLQKNGFRLTSKSAGESMLEELEFLNPREGVLYEVHTSLMPKTSSFYDKHNVIFEDAFKKATIAVFEGHEIYTLEETQHLFFLLSHLLKHFVAGGVGIRQLCDILLFIKKYHEVIDWRTFKGWLKSYHLETFWANLMDIGIRYLGFKPGKYNVPMYDKIVPDSAAILDDMFEAGVFGMSSMARMHSANLTIKAAEADKRGVIKESFSLLRAIFPSVTSMREKYPYLKDNRLLLPKAYVQRIIKFLRNRSEQSDEKGRSVVKLGRERTKMLKKYDIVR